MVPNARPMSQWASAMGFTIARISSGVASVVKSRSLVAATEERVAHRAADEGELVARRGERAAEPRDGRRSGQLAQPVEGRRDTLHAPYVKRARARVGRAVSDAGPLWMPSGCPDPTP